MLHLPTCHFALQICALLAALNISYILCQSGIPYVTFWGSYTTSSCLLALQCELWLCVVPSYWGNSTEMYFYKKLYAASLSLVTVEHCS